MALKKENMIKQAASALLILLLLLSAVFVGKAWAGGHFKSMETLRAYLESYGGWGPLILTMIQALQVVLPVLPGFLGCIVGAAMFGAAGGFWINYIGISAGSIIAYWLARRFGVGLVQKMVPMEKYDGWVRWVNSKKSYIGIALEFFVNALIYFKFVYSQIIYMIKLCILLMKINSDYSVTKKYDDNQFK